MEAIRCVLISHLCLPRNGGCDDADDGDCVVVVVVFVVCVIFLSIFVFQLCVDMAPSFIVLPLFLLLLLLSFHLLLLRVL